MHLAPFIRVAGSPSWWPTLLLILILILWAFTKIKLSSSWLWLHLFVSLAKAELPHSWPYRVLTCCYFFLSLCILSLVLKLYFLWAKSCLVALCLSNASHNRILICGESSSAFNGKNNLMGKITNVSVWLHRMVWSQLAKIQLPQDNLSLPSECRCNAGNPFSERNVLGKYLSLSNSTNRKKNPVFCTFRKISYCADFLLAH